MNTESLFALDIQQIVQKNIAKNEIIHDIYSYVSKNIAALNPSLNALRYVHEKAPVIGGGSEKKLFGIPFSAKDSLSVQGMPRSDGALSTNMPEMPTNSFCIQSLIDEGAYCVGKAQMAEYGKYYVTDTVSFGRTCNPFNKEHTPGGSSGGDAVAVSANFAKFAAAADAGGSVRIPANYCGLFGLFPTPGSISDTGIVASNHPLARLLRSVGIITQSLDDLEYIHEIITKPDPTDPFSLFSGYPGITSFQPKKKFLYYTSVGQIDCIDEIQEEILTIANGLIKKGYTAIEGAPEYFYDCINLFVIIGGQASFLYEDTLCKLLQMSRVYEHESSQIKEIRKMLQERLPKLTIENFLLLLGKLYQYRFEAHALLNEYDFVLSPVSAVSAPKHHEEKFIINRKTFEFHEINIFSYIWNILGAPSIAFPTRLGTNNLPLGALISGKRFSERYLFSTLKELGYTKRIKLH
jgi:Asp-tRNA(Asn)/Glu-tRNA(Gln) amidotransferase A subunit family amidase